MQRRDFLKGFGFVIGVAGSGIGVGAALANTKEMSNIGVLPEPVEEKLDHILLIHEIDWSLKMEKFLNKEFPVPEGKFAPAYTHCAFVIKDDECSKSLGDLIRMHFDPALDAMARPYNNGEVFPTLDLLLPEFRHTLQRNSYGGRIPIRCTLSYNMQTKDVVVALDAIGLELSKPA